MNKKQIIQIVIIVGAFIGAGVILYNGFFKNSNDAGVQSLAGQTPGQAQAILPKGGSLDFNILKKQNLQFNQASYPVLDPKTEIGIPEEALVAAPPAPK